MCRGRSTILYIGISSEPTLESHSAKITHQVNVFWDVLSTSLSSQNEQVIFQEFIILMMNHLQKKP